MAVIYKAFQNKQTFWSTDVILWTVGQLSFQQRSTWASVLCGFCNPAALFRCCCLAGNWHSSLAGGWKMLFLLPPVGHHYVSSAFLGLFDPSLGWFYDPVPCWKKWAVLVLLSVMYWQMLQRPESENGHKQLNWHSQKSRQLLQRKNANLWNHISWSLCNNI